MDDGDMVETMWTDEAKATYRARADALIAALRAHVDLTLTREGRQREIADYIRSSDSLQVAAHAFVDAESDWCGSVPIVLALPDDEADWEDDEAEPERPFLTVAGRWEYRIVDEATLVEAGRRAYLATWPSDTPEDADLSTHDPTSAVSAITHGVDIRALDEAPGLEPAESSMEFWTHE